MKWLSVALILVLVYLQFRLWTGDGSFAEVVRLQEQIEQQESEIQQLRERNRRLALEVQELKTGVESIEERARNEMGMIKDGETFYMVVEKPAKTDRNE